MSVPPEVLHVVRQWVEKAEEDLLTSEHALTLRDHCPVGTICFHAQQCVEKYLKGLLAFHSVPFPKSHDLLEILTLVPESAGLRLQPTEIGVLNRYSVEARYPGDWEPLTREDAEGAVTLARKARESVRACLPKDVLGR
jgi:HEPN domain-containing protein